MNLVPEEGASAPFFFGRSRLEFLAFAGWFFSAGLGHAWQHTDRQAAIEVMRQEMRQRHARGAVLLVFHDRSLVLAYVEGVANCETGQTLTWTTPMLLASLSKPLWGSRLLRLHRSRNWSVNYRVVAGFSLAFREVFGVMVREPMSSSELDAWRQAWSIVPPAGLVTGHLAAKDCRSVIGASQAWAGLQADSGRLALSGKEAASWLQRLLAEDRVGRFLSRARAFSVQVPFRDDPTRYGMGWFMQKIGWCSVGVHGIRARSWISPARVGAARRRGDDPRQSRAGFAPSCNHGGSLSVAGDVLAGRRHRNRGEGDHQSHGQLGCRRWTWLRVEPAHGRFTCVKALQVQVHA